MGNTQKNCGKTILLLNVIRELQLTKKKKKKKKKKEKKKKKIKKTKSGKRRHRFLHNGALALASKVSSGYCTATVQPPFLVGGVFCLFLHLFRSSATLPLYYGIQTTTTIPT